ncbi:amino acid/amide ABC transporter membrane protein 1 (HAAT family) [Humitalea rosea]|uniref:Amino acid/amide ABC transporter membrane protein 1 (HAAT family) n=1 Tax=Humitalea rosea TaxID=990373 RepID=A0A2W7IIP7_9PROT|nr:branched-chain amino acid ABC transporter permease [Humitalea rosea]PZW37829.1 amino acid/amide ABC transporter membrane protein 1 (HAAT family) [Humitalea rosea]
MLSEVLPTALNGLVWAMSVFLVASGLTLIFGILHILNFSHGGFVMIGAYLAFTVTNRVPGTASVAAFLGIAVACAVAVGAMGLVVDRVVFRRLKGVDDSYSLVATYALLLLCEGAVKSGWGGNFLSMSPPEGLGGALFVGDLFVPSYALFVIAAGVAVYLALDLWLHRTASGRILKSVALDPWMASLLGINVTAIFTVAVVAGFALAGLAGGLLAPNQSLSPALGGTYIIQAFGVIIVGGIGNVRGAFLAAVLLGLVDAFGTVYVPEFPGIFFFVAVAVIILFRPQGLLSGIR